MAFSLDSSEFFSVEEYDLDLEPKLYRGVLKESLSAVKNMESLFWQLHLYSLLWRTFPHLRMNSMTSPQTCYF